MVGVEQPPEGGGALTEIATELVAVLPAASVTVRVAVKLPAVEYVWEGFWLVLVEPSPNAQE